MPTILYSAFIIAIFASFVSAADNAKQVEAVTRSYQDTVAKADEVRSKSLEKSRNEAIAQLSKLANKAFADKDRVSETRAWKAILTLDRSHDKAVQYFKDLGTLETVLGQLSVEPGNVPAQRGKIFGRWHVYRDNQAKTPFCDYVFQNDGNVMMWRENNAPELWGTYKIEGDSIVTRSANSVTSRFTVFGDRFLQEQWENGFLTTPPDWFYFGIRAE